MMCEPSHQDRSIGFDAFYDGHTPPWDIGRPQAAFQRLADSGMLSGRVLDVGCGTGEHAMMAAALGLEALGVDISRLAIQAAEAKARARGSTARFRAGDALDIGSLGETFETVLDCGFFHVLDDVARGRFVAVLRRIVPPGGRYHMLCFSDRQPGLLGPRRVTRREIRATFSDGWRIEAIEPAEIETTAPGRPAQAWRAMVTRV